VAVQASQSAAAENTEQVIGIEQHRKSPLDQ
jgi:hypothetical protein